MVSGMKYYNIENRTVLIPFERVKESRSYYKEASQKVKVPLQFLLPYTVTVDLCPHVNKLNVVT
jgi:hypothetical protein